MKRELCLQSADSLSRDELINRINNVKPFVIDLVEKVSEKRTLLLHGEEQTAKRKFRRFDFKAECKNLNFFVRLEEGAIVTNECIIKQCDLYFVYTEKSKEQLKQFLQVLLKDNALILVEPNVYERLKQQQPFFNPTLSDSYQKKTIQSGLISHLFWQIYLVNQSWTEFLQKPLERITLRQLRVKVRRLRSCLTFFKPALRQDEAALWQSKLRRQGNDLAYLRELDVALMTIEKIKGPLIDSGSSYPERLAELLWQARQEEAQRLKEKLTINDMTLEFVYFVIWLQGQPIAPVYGGKELEPFLWQRIKQWGKNIASLTKRYPDFSNMVEMHKIRIKVKRFRYVMMTLPEINQNTGNMLRKLKKLQDTLGFLHDEFVNNELINKITMANSENLQCEAALFNGWENAKVAEAITLLPDLWEDFCEELEIWQDTI